MEVQGSTGSIKVGVQGLDDAVSRFSNLEFKIAEQWLLTFDTTSATSNTEKESFAPKFQCFRPIKKKDKDINVHAKTEMLRKNTKKGYCYQWIRI